MSAQLIAKPDRARTVYRRPNMAYGVNQLWVNPDVDRGDMDGFSRPVPPGRCMAGLGFQGFFLRWLAPPVSRRLLVRPPSGVATAGSEPLPPVRSGAVARVARQRRTGGHPSCPAGPPPLPVVNSADDLCLVEEGGGRV